MNWWTGLTDGQGNVLSAIITMTGAGLAFLFGSIFYTNRVRNLQAAVEQTESHVKLHLVNLEKVIAEVKGSLMELNESAAAIGEKVSVAEGRRQESDFEPESEELSAEIVETVAHPTPAEEPRDVGEEIAAEGRLRAAWESAREAIERAANDPRLDGRTRAAFLRVDRRTYEALLYKMAAAGKLRALEQAVELTKLRNRFRTRRAHPTIADADRAEWLARVVIEDLARQ